MTQSFLNISVLHIYSNKASYRLVLTKQFMEICKEFNLFRKEHNFLSRGVPQRDQHPKATTQGAPQRRPSPRRPSSLVSPLQNRGPQYQGYQSRSPRAPPQERNRRSPSRQKAGQNSCSTSKDDLILTFLEDMSSRINVLERPNHTTQTHQSNPRHQLTVNRPSQHKGRHRGQREGEDKFKYTTFVHRQSICWHLFVVFWTFWC